MKKPAFINVCAIVPCPRLLPHAPGYCPRLLPQAIAPHSRLTDLPLPFPRLPENKIPVFEYRPDLRFFLTVLFCIGVVVWWGVERHASYAWILQDILGFAFVTYLLSRLLFIEVWVLAILMVFLFFYDIFMVFITPFFTEVGVAINK